MLAEAKYQRQKKKNTSVTSISWTNYSCPLLNEIYRLTQTAHMTARDDARRFESRPCSCVGPSVDAAALRTSEIFAHQAWTRWLGSADRVLLLTLAQPLLHDWIPPHTVYCRSVRCFLPDSAHMQTTLEEVTAYSSCLSKSESSRTVSKRTEQHEAFIKKASFNMCVWWSYYQSSAANSLFTLAWLLFYYYYWR